MYTTYNDVYSQIKEYVYNAYVEESIVTVL